MKKTTIGALAYLVFLPILLFLAGGLGAFGENCQQYTADVMLDVRTSHVRIYQ